MTSTERLKLLDDKEHILSIRIIGGGHRLKIGVGLMVFQQLGGISGLTSYASSIFVSAGCRRNICCKLYRQIRTEAPSTGKHSLISDALSIEKDPDLSGHASDRSMIYHPSAEFCSRSGLHCQHGNCKVNVGGNMILAQDHCNKAQGDAFCSLCIQPPDQSKCCSVATPKQIRELMKVDGLTNDEVKSHLQSLFTNIYHPGGNASGGVAGGEMQGGSGYMGGGYGDANGHSGYGGVGWRSDQAAGNYGALASARNDGVFGISQARKSEEFARPLAMHKGRLLGCEPRLLDCFAA